MKNFLLKERAGPWKSFSGRVASGFAFCEVVSQLDKPYHWIQSFITNDKMYCIHIAESE